ncbi:hypothetical protein [Paractinoplanes toevensis]|uniref:Uncharacterized protein n=1 Tax=Paractinoplanes toevensis TaxID=571911 RepID=A0A919TAL8_9ACTN|nr:hypothetical protein [Actinoplanes toevensis]GIM91231.1 hypothetical protein Ato02nite_030240 [Actinoplanes toevensis]
MRKMTKRSTAVVAGAAVAVLGGTAAFAAISGWFNGSSSYASAQSAEIKPVQAQVTALGNLWPGRPVNASVTVGNYNEYKVKATAIDASSIKVYAYNTAADANADTANSAALNTCNETNADIHLAAWPGALSVNPGSWSTPQTFTNFVGMGDGGAVACANKALKITFTLQGEIDNT